jgi:excisionase family DNA binding protein
MPWRSTTLSEQLLTVKQAAARLNPGASLVYDLVGARKLRSCRIGNGRGRIRIPESAIDEYIEGVTTPAATRAPRLAPPTPKIPAGVWPDRLSL